MDTIIEVGNEFCKDIDLLCLDEFQVLHISDAMILKRLFEAFFNNYWVCVLTSNRPPDDLYLNGLQRFLFLPFIEMVKRDIRLVSLSGIDYRTRDTSIYDTLYYPLGDETSKRIEILWDQLTDEALGEAKEIKVAQGRTLEIPKFHSKIAQINFYDLCEKAVGNTDFMALWKNIHTLIITDVPQLSLERRDILRRFIWLIDELYNGKIRLYMTWESPLKELYVDKGNESVFDENFAFDRTASRLIEMQTKKYIENSKAFRE